MRLPSQPESIARADTHRQGFSLVEVTLAVGIITFAVIVLYGLLPTGLAAVRDGGLQESATDIIATAAADLRRVNDPSASSPVYNVAALATSPTPTILYFDENRTLLPGKTDATFQLNLTPRASTNPRLAIWHLNVVWPAQANNPSQSTENVVVLNRAWN